jgi:hypothetical protein
MQKCALCLSGHIRGAFYDPYLKEFIKLLKSEYQVDIYVHTWDKSEADKTYRYLSKESLHQVTEKEILAYFNYPLAKIKIEKEQKIILRGKQIGKIASTQMPIRNWKLMIYGMFCCVDMAKQSGVHYDFIIRTRLDYFSRFHNKLGSREPRSGIDIRKKINSLYKNIFAEIQNRTDKVCWLKDVGYPVGNLKLYIDNFYFGSHDKIHELLNRMNSEELDEIIPKIQKISYDGPVQETFFYYINEAIEKNII